MFPLRDTIPSRHFPLITWILIGINTLVFLFELSLGKPGLERFFYLYGLVPARYSHPQWAQIAGFPLDNYWPFFTHMFLHGGWSHLIGNMWTLWIFGDNVEDRMGRWRFLVFYLLMGLLAGTGHFIFNAGSTIPTVGASGAIAGVLGAYFVLFPHARIITLVPLFFWPLFFELPAVFFLVFWFFTQLVGGTFAGLQGSVGGVAWWAHVGGFIAGVVLHKFFLPRHSCCPWVDEYGIEGAWGRDPFGSGHRFWR